MIRIRVATAVAVAAILANCGQLRSMSAPDAGNAMSARAGTASVSGGAAMSSTRFRLITTTGQGPGNNATTASPRLVLVGGVVGATQAR